MAKHSLPSDPWAGPRGVLLACLVGAAFWAFFIFGLAVVA
jgi:hypothetical protein